MSARLIMMIGPPGSGKSSYIETELARITEKFVVCVDEIRFVLTGDPSDQAASVEAWKIAHDKSFGLIYSGATVVLDATNADGDFRRALLRDLRETFGDDVFIKGVWLRLVPLEACKKRNANRGRVVPEDVIEKMYQDLLDDPPRQEEGFDMLYCPEYRGELTTTV